MLSVLSILIVAAVPVHAVAPPEKPTPVFREGTGQALHDLLTGQGEYAAAGGYLHEEQLPVLEDLYQIIHDGQMPTATVTLADGSTGNVPAEWAGLDWTIQEEVAYTGPVKEGGASVTGSAGAPVIPGTMFPADVPLATNTGNPFFLGEWNPSIAANPTNPANVIEAQRDVDTTQLLTGLPVRCSVRVLPPFLPPITPVFLPVEGTGLISVCTMALVAFSSDGIAYILYTDYEFLGAASVTHFKLIRSMNGGVTWTDVPTGTVMPVTTPPTPIVPFAGWATIRAFPLFGPPSGEIPFQPSLAVTGAGAATVRLNVAYATFTSSVTNDIRSISSNNGGATFTNPVVIESVSPFLPPPLHLRLLLGPSNSYIGTNLHIVWYDSIFLPPPSDGFRVGMARSVDNGATYATGTLAVRPETGFPFSPSLLWIYPTEHPKIASDFATNMVYVICGNSWAWAIWPLNAYDLFFIYNTAGDLTIGASTFFQFPFPSAGMGAPAEQYFPAIATQPLDGTVHVTWADKSNLLWNFGPTIFPTPEFLILYSASDPAHLQPTLAVEDWTSPQIVSHGDGSFWFYSGESFYMGVFFSVSANNQFVDAAWTSNPFAYLPLPLRLLPALDDTWMNRGTKPTPVPVGGTVLSADMLTLLAPYLLIGFLATLGLAYALRRRFRHIALPQIPSIRT